jgi:hypothetical protein
MSLHDVTAVVTAGSRQGYLDQMLMGMQRNLPEMRVIVVSDDGYRNNYIPGIIWHLLPAGTFLTRKRNQGVSMVGTKYTLMLTDDFEIDMSTRATAIRMVNILERYSRPDVIAGTFNGSSYEGSLEVVLGEYIREHQLDVATATPYAKSGKGNLWQVDLATNFFLARTNTLVDVPWDETIGPIGGEHADWFLDMKAAGKMVVWSPGLNIQEQPWNESKELPHYAPMRKKKALDGHALMLKKRGVKRYIGFTETL